MKDKDETSTGQDLLDVTNVCVMVAEVRENGLYIAACNDALLEVSGYSRDEMIGARPIEIANSEDTDIQAIRKALHLVKTGEPGVFASLFKCKNGQPFATRTLVTGRYDDAGTLTHYVFVSTSIDPETPGLRMFGEQGLLAQAEQVSGTGAWRFDYETEELICSENCYALYGLSSQVDASARLYQLIPLSERNKIHQAADKCRKTGEPFEVSCTYYRDDGSRRDGIIVAQPEFDTTGKVVALVGILRDETEVRALRRKQSMFLRAAKIGFVEIDMDEQTISYSADAGQMIGMGRAPGQLSLDDWKSRVHPEDFEKAWASFKGGIKSKDNFTRRYRFSIGQGIYRWLEIRATARLEPGHDKPSIVGTITDIDAQVRGNQELEEVRSRLDLAVDSAAVGLWSWDLRADSDNDSDTNSMSWSPHVQHIFGLAESDSASWDMLESLIHPDERASVIEEILASTEASSDGKFQIEHRCIRPDGAIIWVENRGLARHDEHGRAVAIAGALQDITERKKAEACLIDSERRFHDVAAITGDCIFELDAEGRVTYVSSAAKQVYGYDPEELIGIYPTFIRSVDNEEYSTLTTQAHANQGWDNVERRVTRKDGTQGWINVNGRAILDANDVVIGFRGAVSDITERHETTEKILESNRRVNDIIRIAGGCIFDLDTKGNIIYISDSAKTMFGADPDDLIGQPTYTLAPFLKPRHQEWLDAIRHSDGGFESEIIMTPLNGEPDRWMRTTCRVLTDDNGTVIGYRGIAFDETARKQAALEIINAKKAAEAAAEERARFLATMSHEIRTPLNAMIGMTDLLLDMPQDEEQKQLTTSANSAGRHLLGLVNDILDFSKLDAGKLVAEKMPFDLEHETQAVRDMLLSSAADKGLDLEIRHERGTKGAFVGDPSRIRQILVNLINNAIKFTSQGSVRVIIKKTDDDRIRFNVIDTGTGIDAETLPNLFSDFAQADSSITRKFGGTGLGLAICKRLTEVMGGKIGVDSTPGTGSAFWFEIPLEHGTAAKPKKAPKARKVKKVEEESEQEWHLRILVAEDNPANQFLIKTILTRMGHELVMTKNGLEAVDAALSEHFDLILMDVQMPKLDGVSATRQLREAGCDVPVIALTAHILADEQGSFKAAGMDDWLSKPFDARKLAETMFYWANIGPQPHVLEDLKSAES